jgi:ribitol 2-dehydrogenase
MAIALSGKVAIVTGASSGIGAAMARELVRQGCKVVLFARSADRLRALEKELGPGALSVSGDVVSKKDVERMVSAALERFGRIDVLLANAGLYIPGQFSEGDPEAFARLLDVNVTGVIRCIHAVLPQMTAQKAGDILVTSSISGFVDIHWEPVYSASKHAVQGLVHTLRRQVAKDGIRVGAVAPGMVANELWGIRTKAEIDQHVAARTALTSEDVAEAVIFMLSRPPNVTVRDLVLLPQAQDL